MARTPRQSEDFVRDHVVASDGLTARSAGRWTRDKLGILSMYLPRFTSASKTARATYFVDGMAGPGLCQIRESGQFIRGSTLIALHSRPAFSKCISVDLSGADVEVLRRRCQEFGPRSVVQQGDVNVDLLPLMEREIEHRSAPTLVFLDPEGFAVNWGTVDRLSKFREGGRRVELLLLAMTSGIQRVAAAQDPTTKATVLDWALPPGGDWLTVSDQYLGGEITGGQARDRWAKAYESGLRELGYTYVLSRAVSWRGSSSDPAAYHLVFASDHQAGERIMRYAFDNMFSNAGANVFPGFLDDG